MKKLLSPRKKGSYQYIDVTGLPAPIVQGIKLLVQTLRRENQTHKSRRAAQLPTWPGAILGSLRRSDIYED